ncbi:MAG: valine--tRNA ligase [Lachnospiraceae bacterium]|nr:valine--tRNA ligase [Lachnospiraceae bacterium]
MQKRELTGSYQPAEIESNIYDRWMKKGYFSAKVNPDKKPFTIVMPPPNITGKLHMGHALDNTLQDILIRYKRMAGYEALWIPGTDHASISTEVKVTEQLRAEGIDKHELGRDGFLERTWQWKQEYGDTIVDQLKKIGSSCDWDRLRFTMDEGCSDAVLEVFVKLYEKGYIYKGSRIINWCPVCHTSISDAEVEYEQQQGHFWHIRYPFVDEEGYLEIATTRPETMLGDTALAVHPEDERYSRYIGKLVKLPLTGRQIPVIADSYVERDFGTGVVKITPAHDPNDFEVGKRHDLPEINVMNDDATINELGGVYAGLDRYEARKRIVADLEAGGYLVSVEDHEHNVGTHDRCSTTVEPMIKPQWFVRMEEMAKPAIEAIKSGELRFVPESYGKTYLHWLENIRDWCISRQLWWGHRIPAYTCQKCGHVHVAKTAPTVCETCGHTTLIQDEDTLDTWFSSALWPFSTLGWPQNTEELQYFYPTDVLVTGYDIIFFWVVRMVFSALEQTDSVPFRDVLIHGLVRDDQGRKMSKSLGNGVDPLEVIAKYGADALRLTLVSGNAPGNDMRYYEKRVEGNAAFANKIWNASKFIMMNLDKANLTQQGELQPADRWIRQVFRQTAAEVTANLETYELGVAVDKIQHFIWEEFCDWYIEMVKPRLYAENDTTKAAALSTLQEVLSGALQLLHPFMPFVTEEIYTALTGEDTIMCSQWPQAEQMPDYRQDAEDVELVREAIRKIRNIRSELGVAPSKKSTVIVVAEEDRLAAFDRSRTFFAALGKAEKVLLQPDQSGISANAVSVVVAGATIYLPFEELVNIEEEIERLRKEKARLERELNRVTGMLSNERFISKAPQAKIAEERAKEVKYREMMEQVIDRLNQFGA